MLTVILLGVATCLVFLYFKYGGRPKNFPPGPRGLPLGERFYKLKEKYGPVVFVQVGREYCVILNDFNTIHNALLKEGKMFSGRPSNYIFEIITKKKGLVGVDYGPAWKTLRKFGNQALKG
uniref:cytochrome P450 1A2-like n=1 Tax=Styela clava TaxID=7725 RepID=UPI001939C6D9|nr:cytochrome P450 1A2-like [Styela clava]